MDLYQYAQKTEQSGAEFYQQMASQVSKEGLKRAFSMMASDEEALLGKLARFKKHYPEISEMSSHGLDEESIVFDSICDNGACDLLESDVDAYQLAIRAKKKLVQHYHEAAEREEDPHTRKMLTWLAAFEQHKLREIEHLYDFTNAPNISLESAEFSNLDEFYNFGYYEDLRKGDLEI